MRRSTVALLTLLVVSCSQSADAEIITIDVSAASSLTEAMTQAGSVFEDLHPEISLRFDFGASSDLARSIQEGAPADIFASADTKNMEKVESQDLLFAPSISFATNILEIVVEKGNPLSISSLTDLGDPSLIFLTTNPEVPIGDYARRALEKAGVSVTPDSFEENVKGIMLKIIAGEADAAIVYHSDIIGAAEQVTGIEIPGAFNIQANYPIGLLKSSVHRAQSQTFVDFLLSSSGQKILREYGFGVP